VIDGTFRDGHPRVTLTLPGKNGPLDIEFIVDTGFEGDLALSSEWTSQLDAVQVGTDPRRLADGTVIRCPYYSVLLNADEEEEEPRFAQVLELDGAPLLGTTFLRDLLLQIEVTEGGEVSATEL
jgi:clan AA aspartic protease